MTDNRLRGELADKIKEFQETVLSTYPQEIVGTFRQATQDLVATGIAERSLKEGEKAPDFSLPNVKGGTVTLSSLLAQGPAVVAFYRGVW
jgi:hypothetical protein